MWLTVTGSLLHEQDFLLCKTDVSTRIIYISSDENLLAGAALRQCNLTADTFLAHFDIPYPHRQVWRVFLVTPTMGRKIITVLQDRHNVTDDMVSN